MDESFDKNHYALVFQDYLTKWPEVHAVEDWTETTVPKCLADLICRYGEPTLLVHDHAPEFLAQDPAIILGIK